MRARSTISASLPLGQQTVRVVAGTGSKTASVTVVDRTPPALSIAVSPSSLWPPDGKLVAITPTPTAHDNCDPHPGVTVVDAAFRGGSETSGRTYTIRFIASDAAGNQTSASASVTVPHDKR